MIIQALKVVLEEAELAAKVQAGLGAVKQVKDVTFGLVPGAVKVGGKFQVGFSIPFETEWTVEVLEQGRRLAVRLAHVSAGMLGSIEDEACLNNVVFGSMPYSAMNCFICASSMGAGYGCACAPNTTTHASNKPKLYFFIWTFSVYLWL